MGITFDEDQRKAITRRQLNIQVENAGYNSSIAGLSGQKEKLLQVDNSNKVFYDFYKIQADLYEAELRAINGTQSATFTDGQLEPFIAGDMSNAAKLTPDNIFFPSTPPIYKNMIPKVIGKVNGALNPDGTDARNESTILTNSNRSLGIIEIINDLKNGFGGSSFTTTSTTALVGNEITASTYASLNVNDILYLKSGSNSGVYRLLNIGPIGELTLEDIYPSSSPFPIGTSIIRGAAGFSNTERQNLTSGNYQEILTNMTNKLNSIVQLDSNGNWKQKIQDQITSLNSQNDTRPTQLGQNNAEKASLLLSQTNINNWIALPNTGVTGKYIDTSLNSLLSEVSNRQSIATTRIAEILTALGSVSQAEDAYSGTGTYFDRYKWLNFRVNRASGSGRRYFTVDQGVASLQGLAADNNAIGGEYGQYFNTKKIELNDGTNIVKVNDINGLSVGDQVTVLTETQPEIKRAIMAIIGTDQVKLDNPIPANYSPGDILRMYKSL